MTPVLNFDYWFNFNPGPLASMFHRGLVAAVIFCLLLALGSAWLKRSGGGGAYNRLWPSLYNFGLWNFFIGLFLLFFTFESISFLSSRFWFLLWALGDMVWVGFIIRKLIKIPKIKQDLAKAKQFNKYIP